MESERCGLPDAGRSLSSGRASRGPVGGHDGFYATMHRMTVQALRLAGSHQGTAD